MQEREPKILIIDDDRDISELVSAVLTDEGFRVAVLSRTEPDAVRVAVGQLEPDCVLLDGRVPGDYGESWAEATRLGARARAVPVVMFTADQAAVREARERLSARSRGAAFAGILAKPFDLDELVETVRRVAGISVPFDESPRAEAARTAALVERLEAGGAREIHASTRREWATFRTPDGALVQLYWWQRDGVYYVGRYAETGGVLEAAGRFYDLEAAIAVAVAVPRTP